MTTQTQLVGGIHEAVLPVLGPGETHPIGMDTTGAVRVTTAGAAGPSVVVGDQTIDTGHVPPVGNALNGRNHGYCEQWDSVTPTLTGLWQAMVCAEFPDVAPWELMGAQCVSGLNCGLYTEGAPGVVPTWRGIGAGVTAPTFGLLFPEPPGLTTSLFVQARLAASTSLGWGPVGLDALNQGIISSPRLMIMASGVQVQPDATSLDGTVVCQGLPGAADVSLAASYSQAYETPSAALKASAGWVLALRATNRTAAVIFFQIHNKVGVPVLGNVPVRSYRLIAATGTLQLSRSDLAGVGFRLGTGISVGFSTTLATYTAVVFAAALGTFWEVEFT